MKVIAFNGSPRKSGNTSRLLAMVLGELEAEGIATELYQLGGRLVRGCTSCYKCAERKDDRCSVDDDAINECIAKMFAADGIILGSPTYFADVTTETKALIDRSGFVSRKNGGRLRRKVGAGVLAVRRAGSIHAFDTLNHFFLINEMVVPGSSYWNLGVGLAPGDVDKDEEAAATMRDLGRNMAWVMKKLAG